jgi:hypothetical protein
MYLLRGICNLIVALLSLNEILLQIDPNSEFMFLPNNRILYSLYKVWTLN